MGDEKPFRVALLKGAYWLGLVGAGLGTWLIRLSPADAKNYGLLVEHAAALVKDQTWVVVAMPVVAATAKFALERIDQAWTRKIIHSLLTDYRENLFGNRSGAKHHHRVTLFVRKRFAVWRTLPWARKRFPWSGWLVPVARSDHTTQKVRGRFLAPDHADRCEGVVGSAWSAQATVTVLDLPALTKDSGEPDIKAYCEKTRCNEQWLRKRLRDGESLPRSLRGVPIEVNDVLWGVVMIDSRDPNGFDADPSGAAAFTLIFTSTVGRLMERARV